MNMKCSVFALVIEDPCFKVENDPSAIADVMGAVKYNLNTLCISQSIDL